MESELIELAERCEKAEGPDRKLDRAILVVLGKAQWRGELLYWMGPQGSTENLVYTNACPSFTASIDAALTLVPEGWMWNAGSNGEWGGARCWRSIDAPDVVIAATPALALCAAALRAKAKGGHDAAL